MPSARLPRPSPEAVVISERSDLGLSYKQLSGLISLPQDWHVQRRVLSAHGVGFRLSHMALFQTDCVQAACVARPFGVVGDGYSPSHEEAALD